LSAIERQETRNTPRRLIKQIQCTNNPATEATEVVDELLKSHGESLGSRVRFHNVTIEMTWNIRNLYLAHAQANGNPVNLPELETLGGDEDEARMNNLHTAFQIIQR
jgi:hypothetical protein